MLLSSRIFLSVKRATVTPFTSSMSSFLFPGVIWLVRFDMGQMVTYSFDHPPFRRYCQAIQGRAGVFLCSSGPTGRVFAIQPQRQAFGAATGLDELAKF